WVAQATSPLSDQNSVTWSPARLACRAVCSACSVIVTSIESRDLPASEAMNAWLRPQHQVFSSTRAMPANVWRIWPAGPVEGRDALEEEAIDVVEPAGLHRRQAETCAKNLRRDRSGTASTALAIVSVHGRLYGRRKHRSV